LCHGWQAYITSYNRTTNEDGKWGDIQKWYKKQQKKYKDAVKKGLVSPKTETNSTASKEGPKVSDGDVTCTGGGSGLTNEANSSEEYYDPGPVPKNIYDRGFVENWKEVLFPISLRKEAVEMGGYSRPARTSQKQSVPNTKQPTQIPTESDKTD
jgi:hypothetical protein